MTIPCPDSICVFNLDLVDIFVAVETTSTDPPLTFTLPNCVVTNFTEFLAVVSSTIFPLEDLK